MREGRSKDFTEKQRYWLKHLEACATSGQDLAGYARTHDVGVRQLYTWRSRLRRLGFLGGAVSAPRREAKRAPAPVVRASGKKSGKLGFTAIRVASREESVFDLRVHFPNGIVLEWGSTIRSGPDAEFLRLLAALR